MVTYSTIKASWVAIFEATAVSDLKGGFSDRFRHVATLSDDEPARARNFYLQSIGAGTRSWDPAGARRTFRDLELVVGYPAKFRNRSLLDDIINDDYEQLRNAVLDATGWHADMIAVDDGAEESVPMEIDHAETGSWLHVQFPIEYQSPA